MRSQCNKVVRVAALSILAVATLVSACDSEDAQCAGPFTATAPSASSESPDVYFAGLSRMTEDCRFLVELVQISPTPKYTELYTWRVRVQEEPGTYTDSVTVAAEPRMPAHGHGTAPPVTQALLEDDGSYTLSKLNLFMAGVWRVRVTVTAADGTADNVNFFFELDG
jgi:hypothetical protein